MIINIILKIVLIFTSIYLLFLFYLVKYTNYNKIYKLINIKIDHNILDSYHIFYTINHYCWIYYY